MKSNSKEVERGKKERKKERKRERESGGVQVSAGFFFTWRIHLFRALTRGTNCGV